MNRCCLYLCCWLLLLSWGSRANHIIGGDLSMQLLQNKPGYYRIQSVQYWETANVDPGNADAIMRVMIFRKRNPVLIRTYELDLWTKTPLVYDNAACSTQKKLETIKALYYAEYQFDLNLYTDPGGYYMVWERCCRNNAMVNLTNPADVGMMFYLEFPALSKNGVPVVNSSPVFGDVNGDFICVNKPFSFDMSATDADGDELRYSLVTPYQGYTTGIQIDQTTAVRASYPLVQWQTGFGPQNAIPGSPPLQIDSKNGRLTVKANRTGTFLFSVQVDEYRNGVYIGQTRRDFQLPVIDCNPERPPVAVIQLDSTAVTVVNWCGSGSPTLTVDNNPAWAYQWQRDGDNLPGATKPTFTINEPGDYTVVKSFATRCAGDTLSASVTVRRTPIPSAKLTLSGPKPACAGDTLLLTADTPSTARYRWQRDGQLIVGASTVRLRVAQSGLYKVLVRLTTYTCDAQDSAAVILNPAPTALLQADRTQFCPGDSVLLTIPNATPDQQYTWLLNGSPFPVPSTKSTVRVRQGGIYGLVVTAPGGCSALSIPLTIVSVSAQTLSVDSIPPSCPSEPPLLLLGKPAGGQFSGPGIQTNRFSPAVAGPGRHRIVYTLVTPPGCRAEKIRWAVVRPGPGLRVPPAYTVAPDDTVRLLAQASQPGIQFRWEPPQYLSDPTVATPLARPAESITYRVIAVNAVGCVDTARVVVSVRTRLYIPTAFSPNGDGINDVWAIRNASLFPDTEVTIYDRWGAVVFSSVGYVQPWDGRRGSDRVQAGVYAYQIKTGRDQPEYRGQLVVLE